MKTQVFFISTVVLLLFNSCKKTGDEKFTINGRIYQGCSTTPFANTEISFVQRIGSDWVGQTSGGELGTTTTDVNGNFTFTYLPKNDNDIKIQTSAGFGFNPIIIGLPGKKTLKDLSISYYPRTTIQVRLNAIGMYSQADTLYVTDFRGGANFLKVSGPFSNNVLYNAINVGFDNSYDVAPSKEIVYKIGFNGSWKSKSFQLVSCDTTRVIIDIN